MKDPMTIRHGCDQEDDGALARRGRIALLIVLWLLCSSCSGQLEFDISVDDDSAQEDDSQDDDSSQDDDDSAEDAEASMEGTVLVRSQQIKEPRRAAPAAAANARGPRAAGRAVPVAGAGPRRRGPPLP